MNIFPQSQLDHDYHICKCICHSYTRSFQRCVTLMPLHHRKHVYALYAFARIADEICDNPHQDPHHAIVLLQHYENDFFTLHQLMLNNKHASWKPTQPASHMYHDLHPYVEPVLKAVSHTIITYALPLGYFRAFFTSMYQDIPTSVTYIPYYQTFHQLDTYVYGSAEIFGLLLLPFLLHSSFSMEDTSSSHNLILCENSARALGKAFQLTNFMRDIAYDYLLGRVYIPHELFAQHNCNPAIIGKSIKHKSPLPPLIPVLSDWYDLILTYYTQAYSGMKHIRSSMRPAIVLSWIWYKGIADKIAHNNFNVFSAPVSLNTQERISLLFSHAFISKRKTFLLQS